MKRSSAPGSLGQLDQEQRLEPNAHRLWVHIGVRPAQHPVLTQALQAFMGARRSGRRGKAARGDHRRRVRHGETRHGNAVQHDPGGAALTPLVRRHYI